jgi:hypothetical protein
VIEDVVELSAELNLQTLDRRGELLVQREVSLIERGSAGWVAAGVAEGLRVRSRRVLDGRQNEGIQVDVVYVAGVGLRGLSGPA